MKNKLENSLKRLRKALGQAPEPATRCTCILDDSGPKAQAWFEKCYNSHEDANPQLVSGSAKCPKGNDCENKVCSGTYVCKRGGATAPRRGLQVTGKCEKIIYELG